MGSATAVNQKLTDGTVGQEGPTYSPDGKFLWLPEQNGLSRFSVNADGTLGTPTTVAIPAVNGHSALVGQTKYSPDGSTLYAAINGQNTVVALDPNTGAIEHTWNVGIAPRELSFVGGKLYVSNEGGRQAQPGETTMGSYGTQVPPTATWARRRREPSASSTPPTCRRRSDPSRSGCTQRRCTQMGGLCSSPTRTATPSL